MKPRQRPANARQMLSEVVALRRLWRAVIVRALLDLHLMATKEGDSLGEHHGLLQWPTADDWIFHKDHNDWFIEVCEAAGLSHRAVRAIGLLVKVGDAETISQLQKLARKYAGNKG